MQKYTQTNGHTQTHMDTDVVPLSHFALFVTCIYSQRYKFYNWHATDIHMDRYTNTCTHICIDISTYRYRYMHTDIHKHTDTHAQTHMHIFLHTYLFTYTSTCIYICQVNSACSFYI